MQKTGKTKAKKIPDFREVIKSPEYKNYDIRKALNVEIREWVVPLGNSEEKGIRMLLFVIPKNQSDRKVIDEISLDKGLNNHTSNNSVSKDGDNAINLNVPTFNNLTKIEHPIKSSLKT